MSTTRAEMQIAEEASAGRAMESYPLTLRAHHMAEIFGVSIKRFYALESEGAYLFAENRPRIGRKSWSRDRVQQYFAGEVKGLTSSLRRVG